MSTEKHQASHVQTHADGTQGVLAGAQLSRRDLVKGGLGAGVGVGLGGLTLATVLADSKLAHAVAATLETVTITTAEGRSVSAALARPVQTPAPAVLMVHEWWGLNDQIKSVAAELAQQGYLALAVDLYDGQVAQDADTARALSRGIDAAAASDTLKGWLQWLATNDACSGKIGTIGWCLGGGWSLAASLLAPVDATVVYYGNVKREAAELAALKGPVLGHFATRDKWINQAMIDGFTANMDAAGKTATVHWYEADHAFANPTGNRYDEGDAKLAWQRTTAFFAEHLR